jgi:2-polyprenyl-6-methoxyphenol hydroxylase-like FAD-dependent oxidoreductase
MRNTTVLVSGASIAGPAVAYWLSHYGATVTVVEKAPGPRTGGQVVDFKGATHRTVLTRMGILDDVVAHQTGGTDVAVVDGTGRQLTTMPGALTGGDVEIRHGDLSRVLVSKTPDCEYVYGDSITSLTETDGGVHVTFEHGAPRTVDLVIGADGIHSTVRRLAFGPERDYVKHLGYYYALADIDVHGAPQMYNEPGRMASIGGPKSPAFFVFASDELRYDRYDTAAMIQVVTDAYRGVGWRVPELLAALRDADDVYLDSISRVAMDDYSRGRVVLLGDAAYANTLGGFGTGLAVVGAYVLAGELHRAGGDHTVAFRRYTEAFRRYSGISKNGNAGGMMAPRTRTGLRLRNLMLRSSTLMNGMLRLSDKFATEIDLADYSR